MTAGSLLLLLLLLLLLWLLGRGGGRMKILTLVITGARTGMAMGKFRVLRCLSPSPAYLCPCP